MTEPEHFPIIKAATQPLAFRSEPLASRSLLDLLGPTEYLPLNQHPVNQVCKKFLSEMQNDTSSCHLYSLQLAIRGFMSLPLTAPSNRFRFEMLEQAQMMLAWKPRAAQVFFFTDYESFLDDKKSLGMKSAFIEHLSELHRHFDGVEEPADGALILTENFHSAFSKCGLFT